MVAHHRRQLCRRQRPGRMAQTPWWRLPGPTAQSTHHPPTRPKLKSNESWIAATTAIRKEARSSNSAAITATRLMSLTTMACSNSLESPCQCFRQDRWLIKASRISWTKLQPSTQQLSEGAPLLSKWHTLQETCYHQLPLGQTNAYSKQLPTNWTIQWRCLTNSVTGPMPTPRCRAPPPNYCSHRIRNSQTPLEIFKPTTSWINLSESWNTQKWWKGSLSTRLRINWNFCSKATWHRGSPSPG